MKGKVYVYGDVLSDDVVRINVTSKSKDDDYRLLSPFYVGNVCVEPFDDGVTFVSKRFENAWQYLKVYTKSKKDYIDWATVGWE